MSMNRRLLIKGATAAAGPLLLPRGLSADDTADVVVIGAGLAGLTAAWLMNDAGLNVLVLEGSNRIGGRVWTATDSVTRPELGASQVGPSYARVLDAITRLGIGLMWEDRSIMPFTYHLEGQVIRARDWSDHPANKTVGAERAIPPTGLSGTLIAKFSPLKELDDWLRPDFAAYDIPVNDLLEKNGVSPAARRLVALTQEPWTASALGLMQESLRGAFEAKFAGARSEQVGGALVTRSTNADAAEKWPKNIVGGASTLPRAMATKLKKPVRTGKIVAAVDMDDGGVSITCIDGTRVRARFAIAAVPFSTLRSVTISPAPEALQRSAIDTLGYAETTRAFCTVKEPFWQQDGLDPSIFTDSDMGMFWVFDTHQSRGPYNATFVLTSRAGERVAQLPPQLAAKFLVGELERIRPATKGQVTVNRFHSWGQQPLQKGCRHSFKPGQIAAFANDMIKPWQKLHFAGEHTRRLDYGMEAAMESGERAALEVLQRI